MRADPSLVLQATIRQRLIASADVLALVPETNVMDSNGRPEVMPCVLIGEGQTVFRRFDSTSYTTLHIWFQEPGLVQAKECASAVVDILTVDAQIDGPLHLDGFVCHDLSVTQTQFMRDPHGPYSHGIVTVAGLMKAVA
jgi:hypothetical protein